MKKWNMAYRGKKVSTYSPAYRYIKTYERECYMAALGAYSMRLMAILASCKTMSIKESFYFVEKGAKTKSFDASIFKETEGYENSKEEFLKNCFNFFSERELKKAIGI